MDPTILSFIYIALFFVVLYLYWRILQIWTTYQRNEVKKPLKAHIDKRMSLAVQPLRTTAKAVGYDIFPMTSTILTPGRILVVDTGFAVKPPKGYFTRIDSRSSMAKNGLIVLTHIVDPDYTGTLQVFLSNIGDKPIAITPKVAVAQFWFCPFVTPNIYYQKIKVSEKERNIRYK